jgi:hypothetical protein
MRRVIGVIVPGLFLVNPAPASIATFDDFAEGFQGQEFVDGGIRFFDPVHFFGEGAPFVIEDVGSGLPQFPGLQEHFSSPNVLGLAGFISGPDGWLMGRIEQIKMTTGKPANSARIDVFYDDSPDFAGTKVRLEAMLNGQVVAIDTFTIEGLDSKRPYWNELAISGTTFDTLRLSAVGGLGGGNDDGFLGSLDNVRIIPAPGVLAAGLIAAARPRRRLAIDRDASP